MEFPVVMIADREVVVAASAAASFSVQQPVIHGYAKACSRGPDPGNTVGHRDRSNSGHDDVGTVPVAKQFNRCRPRRRCDEVVELVIEPGLRPTDEPLPSLVWLKTRPRVTSVASRSPPRRSDVAADIESGPREWRHQRRRCFYWHIGRPCSCACEHPKQRRRLPKIDTTSSWRPSSNDKSTIRPNLPCKQGIIDDRTEFRLNRPRIAALPDIGILHFDAQSLQRLDRRAILNPASANSLRSAIAAPVAGLMAPQPCVNQAPAVNPERPCLLKGIAKIVGRACAEGLFARIIE